MQLSRKKSSSWPDKIERQVLLEKYKTPYPVRAHGEAVAKRALELAAQLRDIPVDTGLLRAACELHDIARAACGDHAKNGAEWLAYEGYPDVAAIISVHHNLPPDASVEAQLLYLADKMIQGSKSVSLEERFARSKGKCRTRDALISWERQLRDAKSIIERYDLIV